MMDAGRERVADTTSDLVLDDRPVHTGAIEVRLPQAASPGSLATRLPVVPLIALATVPLKPLRARPAPTRPSDRALRRRAMAGRRILTPRQKR